MTTVEIEVPYMDEHGQTDYLYPYFSGNPYWDNNGIGSYEYAGIRGYDKGQQFVNMDDDPTWDRENFTDLQNAAIATWFKEQHNAENVVAQICEQYRDESLSD